MTLQDILHNKGTRVMTISSDSTLDDAVQMLVQHNIGSLVVCDRPDCTSADAMIGIVTERDILRACATNRGQLTTQTVAEVMTRDVCTSSPSDSVEDVMGLLTERRIRHLPVIDNGKLVGMISIGDVVKAQHDSLSMENHYLRSYIHG
jgi:CBS domain-containing protein